MVNTDRIIVVGDRVLLKPEDTNNKTHGGLYLPPNVTEKEKVQGGYVIKIGPGLPVGLSNEDEEPWKESKGPKYIPPQAKAGDYALYLKKDAVEIELEKEKLIIVPQAAILILLRDEDIVSL